MQFRSRSIGNRSEALTIDCNGGAMSAAFPVIGQAANIADGKSGGGVLSLAGVSRCSACSTRAERAAAGR